MTFVAYEQLSHDVAQFGDDGQYVTPLHGAVAFDDACHLVGVHGAQVHAVRKPLARVLRDLAVVLS